MNNETIKSNILEIQRIVNLPVYTVGLNAKRELECKGSEYKHVKKCIGKFNGNYLYHCLVQLYNTSSCVIEEYIYFGSAKHVNK